MTHASLCDDPALRPARDGATSGDDHSDARHCDHRKGAA